MGEISRREDEGRRDGRNVKVNITLEGASIESVLAKGFGGKSSEYEACATEVKLSFERTPKLLGEHLIRT